MKLLSGTVGMRVDLLFSTAVDREVVGSNPTPARIVVGVFILGMHIPKVSPMKTGERKKYSFKIENQ